MRHLSHLLSYQMHSVASSPQGPVVGSVGRALCGRSSESSMVVGWTVAGGGGPGQSEGTVVGGIVLQTLGAHAGGRVLCCHGNQVVVVVPGVLLLLLSLVVRGVFGRAIVEGAGRGRGLSCQAALLLVVHEGLLVGPGHRTDHLLLPTVRRTW